MTTTSKKVLLAGLISVLACTAYAQTRPAINTNSSGPDLAGTYQCKGYDPYSNENNNFSEILTLTKTGTNNIYSMQLANTDSAGIPYMIGTAIFNPDIKNAISFIVWDTKKPELFGVGLYEIKSDGSLDGVWSTKGTNKTGTETCTKS